MKVQVVTAAVAIVLTASLAACGSNRKSSTRSPAAANASAAATVRTTADAASTTAAQPNAAKSVDICTAVPPTTVIQLTGKQYTVATPGTIGVGVSCAYDDVTTPTTA